MARKPAALLTREELMAMLTAFVNGPASLS